MALTPGTRVGPYEVAGLLGSGGMGEVYRARDTRLGRDVAIKVLPELAGEDEARRARFTREARVIAGLTHPNICTLHDVGEHDRMPFLVMELLEGETLAERLQRGALPLADAITVARQIAAALTRAHRQHIVHRDLKPANVMLTKDGAKLLDFGVATWRVPASADQVTRATRTADGTFAGSIVGTLPYMAPEQVQGDSVDARADLWSLGCVLYEMLTGQRAFRAGSNAQLIGVILRDEPPPIDAAVPSALSRLISTCLQKEPDARWQTAADLERQLGWIAGDLSDTSTRDAFATPRASGAGVPRRVTLAGVLAGLGLLAAGVVVGTVFRSGRAPDPAGPPIYVRFDIAPAEGLDRPVQSGLLVEPRVASGRPSRTALAFSPDNQWLVFVGRRAGRSQLFLRALSAPSAEPVAGTEGADVPFFSPDSRRIGFWSDEALRWVPIEGGPVQQIASIGPDGRILTRGRVTSAVWTEQDRVLYGSGNGVMSLPVGGGTAEQLTTINRDAGESGHLFPQVVPGTGDLVFTVLSSSDLRSAKVVSYQVSTRQYKVLAENATDARLVGDRLLVFMRGDQLLAARFNPRTLECEGPPLIVGTGVMYSGNNLNTTIDTGAGQFAVSKAGHLAYLTGGVYPDAKNTLAWFDRHGTASPVASEPYSYCAPRLHQDSRVVAYSCQRTGSLFMYDFARSAPARLPFAGLSEWPIWSPDGEHIVFTGTLHGKTALYRMRADGATPPEAFTAPRAGSSVAAAGWSANGSELLLVDFVAGRSMDIFRLRMNDKATDPEPVLHSELWEGYPALSPNGQWLAYAAGETSDQLEVYVSPYPSVSDRRQQISTRRGHSPVWTKGGRELIFYEPTGTDSGRLMAVNMTADPFVARPIPELLFNKALSEFVQTNPLGGFAVTSDGQRILGVTRDSWRHPPPADINIVVNWITEVEAKLRSAR